MKTILSSTDFLKIIKGEYIDTSSEYSHCLCKDEWDFDQILLENFLINENISIIEDINSTYPLKILNCEFTGEIICRKGNFETRLHFSKCIFKNDIIFAGTNFESITFSKTEHYNHDTLKSKNIYFGRGYIQSVALYNPNCRVLINGSRHGGISIDGENVKSVEIYGSDTFINSLSISHNIKNSKIDILYGPIINKLYLAGSYSENNKIHLENINVHFLKISSFVNSGEFVINNLKIYQKIKIDTKITLADFIKEEKIPESDIKLFEKNYTVPIKLEWPLYYFMTPASARLYRVHHTSFNIKTYTKYFLILVYE